METELYLREEVKELAINNEDLDEWRSKCEELGLNGQLSLASDNKSPIPFPLMSKAEKHIYSELFNRKISVEEYKGETIPLNILSLIALAKQEEYFNQGIKIWFSQEIPDPIAVGYSGESEWGADEYLIGRWGDVLLDLPTLRKIASEKLANKRKIQLEKLKQEVQTYIDNCEAECESHFMGNDLKTAFYMHD